MEYSPRNITRELLNVNYPEVLTLGTVLHAGIQAELHKTGRWEQKHFVVDIV